MSSSGELGSVRFSFIPCFLPFICFCNLFQCVIIHFRWQRFDVNMLTKTCIRLAQPCVFVNSKAVVWWHKAHKKTTKGIYEYTQSTSSGPHVINAFSHNIFYATLFFHRSLSRTVPTDFSHCFCPSLHPHLLFDCVFVVLRLYFRYEFFSAIAVHWLFSFCFSLKNKNLFSCDLFGYKKKCVIMAIIVILTQRFILYDWCMSQIEPKKNTLI